MAFVTRSPADLERVAVELVDPFGARA